jgi:TIR domain
MSGQIFISYRRDDASFPAGRIYDHIVARFPHSQVFMDVDNLEPGVDFVEAIESSVGSCEVLLAVIGQRWLSSADEKGRRRLDNPTDFVRLEVATALKRGIRVIPVLVEGAFVPEIDQLPDDLKALVRRNALDISHNRFNSDVARLVKAIEGVLEKAEAERKQREKERLEAEQREKDRLEAEQRAKKRLEVDRRQREEAETRERAEKERQEAELRKKERLEAEQQEKERPGAEQREYEQPKAELSKLKLKPKAERSAVPPDHYLNLLQKWSFAPFLLVLVAWFLPFSRDGNVYQTISHNVSPATIFLALLFFPWPIIVLCMHFFSLRSKALIEAVISWVGVVAFIVIVAFSRIAPAGREYTVSILLWLFFQSLGACIKTILARHKLG